MVPRRRRIGELHMAETTELEKAAVPAQEPAALPPKKPKKKRKLKFWTASILRLQSV